ncbi:MAG: glycosyltransferase [Planctomycetota bacterium]|nr:glycosyltransferase [Planctomycetota bacterium]
MHSIRAKSSCPRVLIATASVGAGHNQVAKAIVESLATETRAMDLQTVDVVALMPWLFRAYYAGGFALMMSRFPRIYGLGYRLSDHPQGHGRGLMERRRLWAERLAMRRFAATVLRYQPDLVVQTHFFGPPLIGRMIRRRQIAASQMVVVTDVEVHRFWYSENVERWFVPSDYSAEAFRRWGIAEDRITVSGIPVQSKWSRPLDREKILTDWRLPADREIVLLSGGAEFTCGPIAKIAREILRTSSRAAVVVLAGRNKKLLGKLARFPESGERLFAVGFTDRVHELVEICSVMVTKPGGISTAECLARGKPTVLLRPVPGHEAGNAAWLARQGAAVVATSHKAVAGEVCRLLDDRAALASLSRNARDCYRPGAETVVNEIRKALSMLSASS